MKKILLSIFAILLCFTLVGCGNNESTNSGNDNSGTSGGSEQKANNGIAECTATKSEDSFVDDYDYAKEFMMPKDGVYTGFTHYELYEGDKGYFAFGVSCITESEMEEYGKTLESNGFEFKNNGYYDYDNNVKITISKWKSTNKMSVYVYPSTS